MSRNENANEDLRLFTEPEAAEILGLKPRTLKGRRLQGDVPFHRIGRWVRYTRADLEEFINNSRG